MATKKNLKLSKPQLKQPDMAPIDAVRNPNFPTALAQQDYLNNLAQSLANYQAQTYPTGATKQLSDIEARNSAEQNAMSQQRDPNKEIILNFAGGQFGIANDEAANEIAKKYNLDIVRKPGVGSNVPIYLLRSNGDVNNIISQIKNEQGIGYVEPNFIQSTGFGDTTQRNAAGQQPTNPMSGYMPTDPNRGMPNLMPIQLPQGQQVAMASQYQNSQGPQVGGGMGGAIPSPMVGYGSQQPGNMPIPNMPQNKMADFNNLLQQGMQRNKDFNQAAQNFAGMGGPRKSFSQVAGGIGKLNRAPRKPRPNSIAPSNQKLI